MLKRSLGALALALVATLAAPARADFVLNNTSLTTTKQDLYPIPTGANANNYIVALDYNTLAQAALDLRSAITGGTSGYALTLGDGSGLAGCSTANVGAIRYNNSTHVFEQCANAAGSWSSLGGGGSLQLAYTGGGAGGGTMTLTSSGGPILIKDNGTPTGGHLLDVTDNAGTAHYFSVDAASAGAAVIDFDDGASASASASGKGRIIYNNTAHAFQASVNGGGYSSLGGVSAPLALTPSTDATKGLTIQYHSATVSADPFDILNASGSAIAGMAPVGSGLGAQFWSHSGATGGNILIDLSQGDGNTWKVLMGSGAIQIASAGGEYQWYCNGAWSGTACLDLTTANGVVSGSNLSAGTGGTGSVFGASFQPNTASTAVSLCTSTNASSCAIGRSGITTTVTGTLQVTGNISNDADSTRDIGATAVRYNNVFAKTLSAGAAGLTLTGASTSYVLNASGFDVSSGALAVGGINATSVGVGKSGIATTVKGSFALATQATTITTSFTITPSSGGVVKLTYTSANNVTAGTISAGTDGQELTVMLIQPAAGTAATMVTSWTNVSFAGGAGSFTATLGKRDVYTFVYDGTTSKWYEQSRSLNLTN